MTYGKNLLVLFGLIAAVQCCRFNPTGQQNLDFDRYRGQWYLLETGPIGSNQTGPINCVYESYGQTASPVVYNLTWHGETNTGEIVDDSGIVTLPDLNMKSTMNFFIDGTVFNSVVLATDYETWAIEYSCHDGLGWERFMLRSRTTTLPQEVRTTLHNVINSYGVSVADFAVVNHSQCMLK